MAEHFLNMEMCIMRLNIGQHILKTLLICSLFNERVLIDVLIRGQAGTVYSSFGCYIVTF